MVKHSDTSKKTLFERIFDFATLILLIFLFLYIYMKLSTLPNNIPMRFDSSGIASQWGNKISILDLPFFGILAWVGFSLVEKSPHNINLRIYINDDKEKDIKINRMIVNIIKNGIVICLVFANWRIIEAVL